jgi:hypothetical protein
MLSALRVARTCNATAITVFRANSAPSSGFGASVMVIAHSGITSPNRVALSHSTPNRPASAVYGWSRSTPQGLGRGPMVAGSGATAGIRATKMAFSTSPAALASTSASRPVRESRARAAAPSPEPIVKPTLRYARLNAIVRTRSSRGRAAAV